MKLFAFQFSSLVLTFPLVDVLALFVSGFGLAGLSLSGPVWSLVRVNSKFVFFSCEQMTSLAQPRRALGEIGNRIANNQTRIAQDGKVSRFSFPSYAYVGLAFARAFVVNMFSANIFIHFFSLLEPFARPPR